MKKAIDLSCSDICLHQFTKQRNEQRAVLEARNTDIERTELHLYMDNTQAIYKHLQAVRKNLAKKKDAGTYNPVKAPKAFMHPINRAARDYHSEHGSEYVSWYETFSIDARRLLAIEYTELWEEEVTR